MPTPNDQLRGVFDAAGALLAAREDDMLTTQEWDDLEHAVAEATEPTSAQGTVTFAVEAGRLVRRVMARDRAAFVQRCPRDAYEMVVAAAAEMGPHAFTVEDLRATCGVAWSQAAVVLAFLCARGLLGPGEARHYTVGALHLFEPAMAEYHALLAVHTLVMPAALRGHGEPS